MVAKRSDTIERNVKQFCFEVAPERFKWRNKSYRRRKSIPGACGSHRKHSVTVCTSYLVYIYIRSYDCHLAYGITVLPHPTQVNTPRLNPSQTQLGNPRGMEGWVDLSDWLHTEMVVCNHKFKFHFYMHTGLTTPVKLLVLAAVES